MAVIKVCFLRKTNRCKPFDIKKSISTLSQCFYMWEGQFTTGTNFVWVFVIVLGENMLLYLSCFALVTHMLQNVKDENSGCVRFVSKQECNSKCRLHASHFNK